MDVEVKEWGDLIALQIPPQIADKLDLSKDSVVELTVSKDAMTIRKKRKELTLDEILSSILEDFQCPDDIADFVQSGPVGQEMI